MINLLPQTEKDFLARGYRSRFYILLLLTIFISFIIGAVLLTPSYILARVRLIEILAETVASKAKDPDTTLQTLNLPSEVNSKLGVIDSYAARHSVVDLASVIVGAKPTGVAISSISFSRGESLNGQTGARVSISGTASLRKYLIDFSKSLNETKTFASVDVPVSNLTKEKNVPFSVSLFVVEP